MSTLNDVCSLTCSIADIVMACYNVSSQFQGVTYTTWRVLRKDESGIFIEIEFFDIAVNNGQSLIMFALLGLNPQEVIVPTVRLLKSKWFVYNSFGKNDGGNKIHYLIFILHRFNDISITSIYLCLRNDNNLTLQVSHRHSRPSANWGAEFRD